MLQMRWKLILDELNFVEIMLNTVCCKNVKNLFKQPLLQILAFPVKILAGVKLIPIVK